MKSLEIYKASLNVERIAKSVIMSNESRESARLTEFVLIELHVIQQLFEEDGLPRPTGWKDRLMDLPKKIHQYSTNGKSMKSMKSMEIFTASTDLERMSESVMISREIRDSCRFSAFVLRELYVIQPAFISSGEPCTLGYRERLLELPQKIHQYDD